MKVYGEDAISRARKDAPALDVARRTLEFFADMPCMACGESLRESARPWSMSMAVRNGQCVVVAGMHDHCTERCSGVTAEHVANRIVIEAATSVASTSRRSGSS